MIKLEWLTRIREQKHSTLYVLIFLCCGVLLMVLPTDTEFRREENETSDIVLNYSIEREEERLEEILSAIEGVERCKVLLSVHSGAEAVLAEDEGETVILSSGGKQSTVTVQTRYPVFQGAVIVSGGCDDTSVRYDILSSVMAYTGLEIDRITICPIKNN